MKKSASFSIIAVAILSLFSAAPKAAAQDPIPPPTTPFQSLDTKLEATEAFAPQFQLNRVNLDFRANISLGPNASINPVTDDLRVEHAGIMAPEDIVSNPEQAGVVTPSDIIFIPAGCFSQRGNGFRVRDPQGCGVSIRLEFPPNSNLPPIDLTPGLRDFDARLSPVSEGGGVWNLRIELSFLDIRQAPQPCFLTILGGAEQTIVQIGNDTGETMPRKLEVAGSSQ